MAQAANLKEVKDVRIAFVVHGSASDPYWSVVKRGVDDAAALTGATVEYHSPQVFDVVEQARLMEAAIATKPDGIAVSIADADAMKKSVQAALAAGIAVVVVDSGEVTGEEMGTTLYVGTVSEYDSGKKAGERLAKDGILKVVCINHEVGNVSLDDRCRGLNDGLSPSGGGTEVVAVTPDPADITRRTEAYLSAHPDVQGVFAMGAGAANPLIPMFRDKELFGKLKLYTFDISPEVLDFGHRRRDGFWHGRPAVSDGLPAGDLYGRERHARFLADQQLLHRPALHRHAGQGPGHARPRQGRHPLIGAWDRAGMRTVGCGSIA